MKVNIIKKVEFVARDENGEEYPLLNFNGNKFEYIEHSSVPGTLIDGKIKIKNIEQRWKNV